MRTLRDNIREGIKDPEYVRLYGAADFKTEIAIKLCLAREAAGMTQAELAKKMGISQPYLSKLEGGEANPSLSTIGSILAVLGYRLEVDFKPLLVGLEDEPEKEYECRTPEPSVVRETATESYDS